MAGDGSFAIERSIEIDAPSERIYGLIERFKSWTEWSPWEGLDPNLVRDYSGPEAGVGSKYGWQGNRKVGKGSMELIAADPPNKVEIDLRFLKPWKAENLTIFELAPAAAGGTTVVWRMTGTQSFGQRLMGKIFNMEKLVGNDFEKGLAQLKAAAERDGG